MYSDVKEMHMFANIFICLRSLLTEQLLYLLEKRKLKKMRLFSLSSQLSLTGGKSFRKYYKKLVEMRNKEIQSLRDIRFFFFEKADIKRCRVKATATFSNSPS